MNTPIHQIQGQRGQVGIENFGLRELSERSFACLVPEPITDTGLQPTCTALPLGRAGQGNRFGEQPGHAALGVEPGNAGLTTIYHHPNAFDRQAGLGNSRRQNDLPSSRRRWGNSLVLLALGQCPIEWQDIHITGQR